VYVEAVCVGQGVVPDHGEAGGEEALGQQFELGRRDSQRRMSLVCRGERLLDADV
jgi:hypothetical protein